MCERFINSFVEKVIEKTKNPLKLYHVKRPYIDYLSYDSCEDFVTANYTEDEARNMKIEYYYWVKDTDKHKIIVTEIGYASEHVKPGIIIRHINYG
jgi:hypothetical protein